MAIDVQGLWSELAKLRALAKKKLSEDPLPVGRESTERLRAEIAEHGLAQNIVDLELDGYTILPPGKAAPMELVERIREALERVARERPVGYTPAEGLETIFNLLPHDRAFEEALVAPVPGTLVTYLLGYRAKLSSSVGLIKGVGGSALPLHADHSTMAAPWPRRPEFCNVTWALTEYTRENGAVTVWPGSHRWGMPVPPERNLDSDGAKILEMPAGSVLVWHGSLWHGAIPRQSEGKRMTLILPCTRGNTGELGWVTTTPEMIERNPRRFSTFMGLHSGDPWTSEGPYAEQLIAPDAFD